MPIREPDIYAYRREQESKLKMSTALKGRKLSDCQKQSISAGLLKMYSDEIIGPIVKEKISSGHKGKIVSEETREKLSKLHLGKTLSEETKHKISIGNNGKTLGIPKTEEHKQNISKGLKGLQKTKEHMEKINKNPEKIRKTSEKHRGMKRTSETCLNISLSRKGKPAANKGGKYYYDPDTLNTKLIMPNEQIPNGWINGMPRKNKCK